MEEISVAIVSESQTLMESLQQEMRKRNFYVILARNTKEGISRVWFERPNVIILDWNSIIKDGQKICRAFKEHPGTKHSFIIVLTSEEVISKYDFELELDDFVLAPVSPLEIDARIRKVQGKFAGPLGEESINVEDMEINESTYEVTIKEEPIRLTHKEFELLKFLASNRGRVFTREALLSLVWKYDFYHNTRTVDIHIQRVRSKIGSHYAKMIKTVPNVGYKFLA